MSSELNKKKKLSPQKTIRLTSQADYVRPHRIPAFAGVTSKTDYQATLGAITPDDAERRCVASNASLKFDSMILEAAKTVPLELADKYWAESVAAVEASGETAAAVAEATKKAAELAKSHIVEEPPKQVVAETELLAGVKRMGVSSVITQQFFAAGSPDGPFPGSKSANGKTMAEAFYKHVKPGGKFAVGKPNPYSEGGYRLHNFDKIG